MISLVIISRIFNKTIYHSRVNTSNLSLSYQSSSFGYSIIWHSLCRMLQNRFENTPLSQSSFSSTVYSKVSMIRPIFYNYSFCEFYWRELTRRGTWTSFTLNIFQYPGLLKERARKKNFAAKFATIHVCRISKSLLW